MTGGRGEGWVVGEAEGATLAHRAVTDSVSLSPPNPAVGRCHLHPVCVIHVRVGMRDESDLAAAPARRRQRQLPEL